MPEANWVPEEGVFQGTDLSFFDRQKVGFIHKSRVVLLPEEVIWLLSKKAIAPIIEEKPICSQIQLFDFLKTKKWFSFGVVLAYLQLRGKGTLIRRHPAFNQQVVNQIEMVKSQGMLLRKITKTSRDWSKCLLLFRTEFDYRHGKGWLYEVVEAEGMVELGSYLVHGGGEVSGLRVDEWRPSVE